MPSTPPDPNKPPASPPGTAEGYFRVAVQTNPGHSLATADLARNLHYRSHNPTEALKAYRAALASQKVGPYCVGQACADRVGLLNDYAIALDAAGDPGVGPGAGRLEMIVPRRACPLG